ncbi:chorismate mutase, partial [Aliarcobacter butzleri]
MANEDGLLELRNQLDNIDNKLLDLLNERMKIVHKVG